MNKAKTVILLGKYPPPYMGPAVATKLLLESSLSKSFRLIHVNTNTHSTLATLGRVRIYGVMGNLLIYIKYVYALSRHGPELTLVPISQTTVGWIKDSVFIVLAVVFRKRVAIILRGSEILEWYMSASRSMKWYFRSLMRMLHAAFVLSDRLHYLFEPFMDKSRIYTVTNGCDCIKRERERSRRSVINIVYLSNLQPSKGIQDVIDALVIVQGQSVQHQLHVAGYWFDEDTRKYCEQVVSDYELPVCFHDPITQQKEKEKYLSAGDIFIFVPRRPEGQPWAIIEALGAGLPIIATDQGAIRDMVHDNENGYIVPPYSPEHIAARVSILLENRDLRHRMGVKSREIYERGYTLMHMVNSFRYAITCAMVN